MPSGAKLHHITFTYYKFLCILYISTLMCIVCMCTFITHTAYIYYLYKMKYFGFFFSSFLQKFLVHDDVYKYTCFIIIVAREHFPIFLRSSWVATLNWWYRTREKSLYARRRTHNTQHTHTQHIRYISGYILNDNAI